MGKVVRYLAVACIVVAPTLVGSSSNAEEPPISASEGTDQPQYEPWTDSGGNIPAPSGVDIIGPGIDEIARRMGARYGGVWSDPSEDLEPTIHVALADPRPSDKAEIEAISEDRARQYGEAVGSEVDVTVLIQQVSHPLDALISLQREAEAFVSESAKSSSRRWSSALTEVDVRSNRVEIEIDAQDEALRANVARRFAGRPISVVEEPGRKFALRNANRDDYPPYIAGLRLSSTGDYLCTSGFVFKTGTSRPYYGSTAGHCEDRGQNETWRIGGDVVGVTAWNGEEKNTSSVIDALLYEISYTVTSSKIYVNDNSDRYVRRRAERSDMANGSSICVSPQSRTGGYCGSVYRTNFSVYIPDAGKSYREAYCVGISGNLVDGDSGAPFYKILPTTSGLNNAAAAGLMSFTEYMPNGSIEECFISVIGIEADSGRKVGVIPY